MLVCAPGFTAEQSLGKFYQDCHFGQTSSMVRLITEQSTLSLQLISRPVGATATAGLPKGGCCCTIESAIASPLAEPIGRMVYAGAQLGKFS